MQIVSLFVTPTMIGDELKFELDMKFLNSEGIIKNIITSIDKNKMQDLNKVFSQFVN
jgi:hypothetical protein